MKPTPERIIAIRSPVPPIVIGRGERPERSRGETALRWLLRGIALLWLIEGAQHWVRVLTEPATSLLPGATPAHIAALFFFCILDFVAAIGLWLVSGWGVAVWVATILGQGLAIVFAPGFLSEPGLLMATSLGLLAAYGALAAVVRRGDR